MLRVLLEPKEYTSHQLERELRRHGALASMGSVADCFDNALAESVFATLECELFDQQPGGRFNSRHEAKLAVFDYLEALSRYAGDLFPGRWDRGAGVTSSIGARPWPSHRAWSAPVSLAEVS